jgi:UDP-N-acetylmuramoyl-tripeptide--D-alanyl-D-alanine ligase
MIRAQLLLNCKKVKQIEGKLNPENTFNFCSDSRSFKPGDLFFCIPGEKFNPVVFVADLLQKGLSQLVVEFSAANQNLAKEWIQKKPDLLIVWTHSVVGLIQELACNHIQAWKTDKRKVIAISGSNGKTTTKEMLAFLLKGALGNHHVVATEKNNNNQLGVPYTLFNVHQLTEVVVLEFGSNHPGEIKLLCETARPDWAITTNIGATHLEFFHTEEAVFQEEAYVYQALQLEPEIRRMFFINEDDSFLKKLPKKGWTVSYGENNEAQVPFSFSHQKVKILGSYDTELSNQFITGKHNFFNLAVAWLIASTMFPEHRGTFSFLAGEFKPTLNRSEWREFQDKKIFLDAYNANPSSMKAAISGFIDHLKEHHESIAHAALILGDMNELGARAPELHEDLGKFVHAIKGLDIYFIGRYQKEFLKGCPAAKICQHVQEFKEQHWRGILSQKSSLMIKASRSLQLESILDIT